MGHTESKRYIAIIDVMSNVVTTNLKILGGTPVFVGTRVPAESLFDYLKRGRSIDYFLEQFPTVKREQVQTQLKEASCRSDGASSD
jgi:uncharacterized protein (DUF433 family)